MPSSIIETTWHDVPVLKLAADDAAATISPSLGANLFSLTFEGMELLRTPPHPDAVREEPARWGIPVLMPPNRIANATFTFGGREYRSPASRTAAANLP